MASLARRHGRRGQIPLENTGTIPTPQAWQARYDQETRGLERIASEGQGTSPVGARGGGRPTRAAMPNALASEFLGHDVGLIALESGLPVRVESVLL